MAALGQRRIVAGAARIRLRFARSGRRVTLRAASTLLIYGSRRLTDPGRVNPVVCLPGPKASHSRRWSAARGRKMRE